MKSHAKKSFFSFYIPKKNEDQENHENFLIPFNPLYSFLIDLMIFKSWKKYANMMHENPQQFLRLENDSESSFLEMDEKSSSSENEKNADINSNNSD